jgi:TonB dependent receptor
VVNAITKSGTNTFHGTGLLYFEGSGLGSGFCPNQITSTANCSGGRATLRQSLTNDSIAEYITYPEDDRTRYEPGFAVGGPIVRDKAWFFGAYQPTFIAINRTVGDQPEVQQEQQIQYATASQVSQWSNSVRSRVAFNNNWNKTEGLLPTLNGTDPAGTNYGKTSEFPNYSLSGNVDYVASPRLFFGVRGGYFLADQHDSNVTEEPRFLFGNTTNVGMAGVPLNLQHGTQFQSIPSNNKVTQDKFTRAYFQADATVYANMAGAHQIKFGVQADRLGNRVLSGEARNRVSLFWNSELPTGVPVTRGTFGYYSVRSNAVAPKQGFITEGDIHTTNIGLFIQDAWTIGNRFTINAGLRTERERVPTYTVGEDVPEFGVEFDFADKIALVSASRMTSRATGGGRRSGRGACSTTSSSSSCRAARSAATSGSSTTTHWTHRTGRRSSMARTARPPARGRSSVAPRRRIILSEGSTSGTRPSVPTPLTRISSR